MLHKLPLSVQLFSSIVYVIIFNSFCNSQLTLSLRSKLIFMFYCLFMVMQIALSRSNGALHSLQKASPWWPPFFSQTNCFSQFGLYFLLLSDDDFHLGIVAVGENLLMHKAVTSKYLTSHHHTNKETKHKKNFPWWPHHHSHWFSIL